jgi:hypothetical protein
VILPPINEVIDLHSMHLAMARRHLPTPIMAVLLGTAAVSLGIVGFGNGRIGRRFSLLDAIYGAVLAAALWMTIDMDYPGGGMIRVSNRPVVEALAAMIGIRRVAQARPKFESVTDLRKANRHQGTGSFACPHRQGDRIGR